MDVLFILSGYCSAGVKPEKFNQQCSRCIMYNKNARKFVYRKQRKIHLGLFRP